MENKDKYASHTPATLVSSIEDESWASFYWLLDYEE